MSERDPHPADEEVHRDRPPGVPPHQPPAEERPPREAEEVDEASEESFPSSDPPALGGPA
jgi:hypothetical protein